MQKAQKSWEKFKKSTKFLGLGSSTLSKIPSYEGIDPAQISHGKGCRVWDLDGNEYIDYRNGLGPITLGYCIPEINEAIIKQLEKGILFGHPHPLEGEVAEMLVEVLPCAERVRFLKTGGEAVAACIKIARNYTNRNMIVHCGYNGWVNSLCVPEAQQPAALAASNPTKGIPPEMSRLHLSLPWNEPEVWEKTFAENEGKIAAVVAASSYGSMEKGKTFYPFLRDLCNKNGTLLIIDEIVTGFRLAIGGAQEYFNFIPDMAVFAKGVANGMPLSIYAGKAELIESAKQIGISSTYPGETLTLAAAKATINFYRENNVIEHLWKTGESLWSQVNKLFEKYQVKGEMQGVPVCPQFAFEEPGFLTSFMKESYQQGLSFYTVSYVNFSHKENDVAETLERMETVLKNLSG